MNKGFRRRLLSTATPRCSARSSRPSRSVRANSNSAVAGSLIRTRIPRRPTVSIRSRTAHSMLSDGMKLIHLRVGSRRTPSSYASRRANGRPAVNPPSPEGNLMPPTACHSGTTWTSADRAGLASYFRANGCAFCHRGRMTVQPTITHVITSTQKTKNQAGPWDRAKNARPNATGATIKLTSHGFLDTAAHCLVNPRSLDLKIRTSITVRRGQIKIPPLRQDTLSPHLCRQDGRSPRWRTALSHRTQPGDYRPNSKLAGARRERSVRRHRQGC